MPNNIISKIHAINVNSAEMKWMHFPAVRTTTIRYDAHTHSHALHASESERCPLRVISLKNIFDCISEERS